MRDHAFRIERDDAHLRVGKVFGNSAAARTERVVGIRNRQLDRFDSDFEYVTRLRAFDEDWPGENVPARSFVGNFFVDVAQRLLDIRRLDARALKARRTGRDQRLHFNRVTGFDPHHRRGGRVVISPGDRFGCGL